MSTRNSSRVRADLAGRDLAFTCALDDGQPCHADVLLRVANGL